MGLNPGCRLDSELGGVWTEVRIGSTGVLLNITVYVVGDRANLWGDDRGSKWNRAEGLGGGVDHAEKAGGDPEEKSRFRGCSSGCIRKSWAMWHVMMNGDFRRKEGIDYQRIPARRYPTLSLCNIVRRN